MTFSFRRKMTTPPIFRGQSVERKPIREVYLRRLKYKRKKIKLQFDNNSRNYKKKSHMMSKR